MLTRRIDETQTPRVRHINTAHTNTTNVNTARVNECRAHNRIHTCLPKMLVPTRIRWQRRRVHWVRAVQRQQDRRCDVVHALAVPDVHVGRRERSQRVEEHGVAVAAVCTSARHPVASRRITSHHVASRRITSHYVASRRITSRQVTTHLTRNALRWAATAALHSPSQNSGMQGYVRSTSR